MVHRKFPKKRKTHLAYGKRKRTPPKRGTSRQAPVEAPDNSQVGSPSPERVVSVTSDSQQPTSDSDASFDPGPSTSYADAAELRRGRAVTRVPSDATSHQRGAARSPARERRISKRLRRTSPSPKATPARLKEAPCRAELCFPSTSDSGRAFSGSTGAHLPQAKDRQRGSELPSSPHRTIQAHIQPTFVSAEAVEARASAVRESLAAISASERKLKLTKPRTAETPAASEEEYIIVQMAAMNSLLAHALCPCCLQPTLAVERQTKLGLAVKMVMNCSSCGTIDTQWSSERKEGARVFDVNVRSMQAIRSIGKGPTALNDFWATMNVSHRGLHQKTYQAHLKKTVKPAAEEAARNIFADAAQAVRHVYTEMEVNFVNNITVVYDGTWLTRGHSSHIGVGCVIEFYTGLVLDCVVLSNFCLGCTLGPAEDDPKYPEWKEAHQCQKNTNVSSGRMEVEAALMLLRRSLSRNGLRYTTIICDGDSRTYLALCEDQPYGFIPLTKEDCINHVKKRMGTNLRALKGKAKKGEPLGGRGGLTQDLIKKLTNYYGHALRNHTEVDEMQRAVMATFYHITSTDAEPHHELCPPGPLSWCKHRAAEAEGKPQPPHKYKLHSRVAEALLPVYQRLSDPQLLERCRGNKTQNASESLHSVVWSLLSKDEHASLFTVEAAVHEAVAKYNSGSLRAYTEVCAALGIKPGTLAIQRAAEKDRQRTRKASHAHQIKGQKPKRSFPSKDSKDYASGAF